MSDTNNVKVLADRQDIVAIADAVRNKTGKSGEMTLGGIVTGINSISTGANTSDATATENDILADKTAYINGGKVTGTMPNNGNLSKTMDGINTKSVIIPSGYTNGGTVSLDNTIDNEVTEQTDLIAQIATVVNSLPEANSGTEMPLQEKTIDVAENGTTEVIPDDGYALSKVTANVNVPIPDGYIQPSGSLEITENGTFDVRDKEQVLVSVSNSSGGGGGSAEINMNTCTVKITVPSSSNYYVQNEAVSGGAISYNIARHYTGSTITKTVRCDSVMYISASTIKGVTVSDGELLKLSSGYGIAYKTPSVSGVTATVTLTA